VEHIARCVAVPWWTGCGNEISVTRSEHPVSDLSRVRNMISSVIDDLGGDSYDDRLERNAWRFRLGSAIGTVVLIEDEREEEDSDVSIIFPIMKLPVDKALPFYRRLLEVNYALNGKAAFCIDENNAVCLLAGRVMRDIDPSELADLIHRTAWIADKYDDLLLDEFGRENALSP